jgi:Glycosyl hydrolase family 9/Cellulase N-terminal ig-like domain
MRKRLNVILGIAMALQAASFTGRAANARYATDYSVQVSARVQTTPSQITLQWLPDHTGTPASYTVYRRAPGTGAWGNGITLSGNATSFDDKDVSAGSPYEYQIIRRSPACTAYGYIYAGINVPAVEQRGKMLLVVDRTYATELTSELNRLQQDLVGDGWAVTRLDVDRGDSVVHVKNLIKAQYQADPANLKAVFLFGHVPVPYSGNIVPDGHYRDHEGAWPCDGYYADMDGTWTDDSVNDRRASDPRNHNVPRDGKFDQSTFPAPLKLMVGRVDLANMPGRLTLGGPPTFPSELELLRNYLNKDHNFRRKIISAPERGIVGDYFGAHDGEAFAASAWRNFAPFFGTDQITTVSDRGTWIPTLSSNAYLWAYGCGSGSYTSMGGIGNVGKYDDGVTTELVQSDLKAVFTMLYGSWLGDWDSEDNLQRAVLATRDYGLTCSWSGRPHWFLQHMALGEPIGFSTLVTQNDGFTGLYQNERNNCAGWVHIALMGDPTLRMRIVAPPSNVATKSDGNHVVLNWDAADDSIAGYNVYRGTSPNGPFTRVNTSPVTDTTYTDANAASDRYTYMVRAVKLENSASGTYFNLSNGEFARAGGTPAQVTATTNVPAVTHDGKITTTGKPASGHKLTSTGEASGTGANDTVWFDDELPAGAVGNGEGGDWWTWVNSSPAPFSGNAAHQSGVNAGLHQHFFDWAANPLAVNAGDTLFAYVYLDPANVPSELMLQWTDGNWEHRAYWGANNISYGTDGTVTRHYMGPLPAAGQWVRLEVSASLVGLAGSQLKGMAFSLYGGRATWDYAGKSTASDPSQAGNPPSSGTVSNTVWFDDAVPVGAVPDADNGDGWNWVNSNPAPYSGKVAHQSNLASGMHQHFFDSAYGNPLTVNVGEALFAYVYLDPADVPSELMLQWNDGSWEHRAYWGANTINWGADGTVSRLYMGPMPAAGQWVRLEVPASQVGLEGSTVKGMAFTEYNGRATWDHVGKASFVAVPPPSDTGTNNSGTNDTSVVGTNTPPVVSTNPPPTTTNPPAASDLPGTCIVDDVCLKMPKPGDYALKVLTPTLLELKLINTKGPAPARVTQWDWVNNNLQFTAPPASAFAVTVNGQPVPVQSVGFKRRPLYAPLVGYDLRIENSLYLQLGAPVADNQTVVVKNVDSSLWNANQIFSTTIDPLRYSPSIHVNQEGYLPNYSKKAMVGYYLGNLGEMNVPSSAGFKIVDTSSGSTVYQGSLTARPDVGYQYTPTPYQKVYEADFTSFNTPGQYRLVVPGLGASLPFAITEGIAMDFARTYALGLYHQRCGTNNALPYTRFTHDLCHMTPAAIPSSAAAFPFTWSTISNYTLISNPDNPVQTAPKLTSPAAQLFPFVKQGSIDVSGGHHDAGDYSKYTLNSVALIHYLMFAVDSLPGVAALDNLGIPESGDGISDVLQEAKWEADFLAKMQDSDGGFYFLVYPQTREYESNVTPDHGDPQLVWPKTSSATAASVAALAQCASSPAFKQAYPAAAALYLQKAQLGWQFLMNGINRYGKNGIYQKITHYGDDFADQDELAWAACEMYLATGNPQYQQTLFQWFPDPSNPATFRWGWWRMYLYYGNAVRSYAFAARSGRLASSQLDPNYLAKCVATVTGAGDDLVTWSKQNAYGTSFPEATKHVQGAGWYFSGDQTFDLTAAYQLNAKPDYLNAIIANMNYEAGCNPVNVSYITGLGWKQQRDAVSQYAANDRRMMPPSGEPLGNIQSGFSYTWNYGIDLRALCFPQDEGVSPPYPFYDRWGDSWNVSTEFVAFQQARSLATYAFLAAQTSLKSQPWKSVQGQINVPSGTQSGPITFTLQAPGVDLTGARITWETRDGEPCMGSTFTFAPRNNGSQWIEAEAVLPDGRRVFAATDFVGKVANVVWFDDSLPAGANPGGDGGDSWNWVGSNPTPYSGASSHQSALASGMHQHFFQGATAVMTVSPGTVLNTWVYLDPANPPTEIMLQWNDTSSWEHRAYWGANNIGYGTDGTASRRYMGPLPATGQWVQLQVPASQVGLEGTTVNGMGFTLFGGRANWDAAGLFDPSGGSGSGSVVTITATDASRIGPTPGRFTFTRTGNTDSPLAISYSLGGTASSGVDYQPSGNTVTIPAGATFTTLDITPTAVTSVANAKTVVLTPSSSATYSVAAPGNATLTIAGNIVANVTVRLSLQGPIVSWPSTAGAVYRVAYKNNLSDSTWTFGSPEITATGATCSWTDPNKRSHRYYTVIRVR